MLYIWLTGRGPVTDVIVPGEHLEDPICQYEGYYPDYRKIVIYEADTREATGIIKSNRQAVSRRLFLVRVH